LSAGAALIAPQEAPGSRNNVKCHGEEEKIMQITKMKRKQKAVLVAPEKYGILAWLAFAILIPVIASCIIAGCGTSTASEEETQLSQAHETEDAEEEIIIEGEYEIIVVGAGIAGLTAAYHLDDYDIAVLEKESVAGGRVIAAEYAGFTYAKGAEYLGYPEGALAKMIEELGVPLSEIPSPCDMRFDNGQFYYGEAGLALFCIERSSVEEYNRFVATIQQYAEDYDEIPEFEVESDLAALDGITARAWFEQEGFSSVYQEVYNVAARGLFGASIDEISALSYIPEIAFDYVGAEPVESLAELRQEAAEGMHDGQSTSTYSFPHGLYQLTTAIAESLGDRLRYQACVTEVVESPDGEGYLVTYVNAEDEEHCLYTETVILAVPAPVALVIAGDVLTADRKRLLQQIPYATYATVALLSAEPVFREGFDMAVPDGWFFTDVYDATWVQRYYQPDLDTLPQSIFSVYIGPPSYKDRSLLTMTDEEILEQTHRDLERIYPDVRDLIDDEDIHRFPYAYPVMIPGAYARLTQLHELQEDDGVILAGDYMIYPTFEAAAESGYLASQYAAEWLVEENE